MLGIVTQARRVQARITSLVQLNLELAKVEGKRKATALGIALGLAGLAAVLVLYAIGFLFATAAVALNGELALWASLLIVAGAILVFAAIAAFVAMRYAKKVSPPDRGDRRGEADCDDAAESCLSGPSRRSAWRSPPSGRRSPATSTSCTASFAPSCRWRSSV